MKQGSFRRTPSRDVPELLERGGVLESSAIGGPVESFVTVPTSRWPSFRSCAAVCRP